MFGVAHHRVDLIFNHNRRIVERAHLDHGIKHAGHKLIFQPVLLACFGAAADAGLEVLKRLKVRTSQLGKVIVEFGLIIRLDLLHGDGEGCFLARIHALPFCGPAQHKLRGLSDAEADQFFIKARRLHGVLLVGRNVPVGLVQHNRLFAAFYCRDHAADVNGQHVAILAGTLDHLP